MTVIDLMVAAFLAEQPPEAEEPASEPVQLALWVPEPELEGVPF